MIDDEATIAALTRAVDALPALYIADGHHRSAAALRVAEARGRKDGYFLAVLLPQQQMTILDYNRVLRDLNGLTPRRGLERNRTPLRDRAKRSAGASRSRGRGRHGFRWTLAPPPLRPEVAPRPREVTSGRAAAGNAACAIRHRADFRRFRSAARQAHRVRRRRPRSRRTGAAVSSGEMAVAFALYPTQMRDLMAVADAGAIMPPNRPGSNRSSPMAWSVICWTDCRVTSGSFSLGAT